MIERKSLITDVVSEMHAIRAKDSAVYNFSEGEMPSRDAVIAMILDLKQAVFLGYFGEHNDLLSSQDYVIGECVCRIYETLKAQLCLAYSKTELSCRCRFADEAAETFIEKLPELQKAMLLDLDAAFSGDPAAQSKGEIIYSYPGFLAIFIYRAAHILYEMGVPLIPRIMTEYAHSRTGIDIHAGAQIGSRFFIDHGTGVVIGETSVIGNNVKIYQGVTLGALSTREGRALSGKKRHPTIENDVTIYAGATILGGQTVIGEKSIIGGNVFITDSVPANTVVTLKKPDLVYKEGKKS